MKIKNKKGNVQFIIVTVLLIIVTFFVYLAYMEDVTGFIFNDSNDLSCRMYVAAKDFPSIKLGEFFYNLREKCLVDEDIKVNLEDKDKSFDKIASEMSSCWYRYGEGQYDFLESFGTSGNWCFLCGKVQFEDNSQSYQYRNFVEWSKKNNYNDSTKYFDYIALKHIDVDDEEVTKVREEYEDILHDDPGAEMNDLLFVLSEQVNYLNDFQMKKIDSSDEEMFIVYRYDRIDKTYDEKFADAGEGVLYGAFGAIVAGAILEGFVQGAIVGGAAGLVSGGLLSVPMAMIGGVFRAAKGMYKSVVSINKVFRVTNLIKKTKNLFKISTYVNKIDDTIRFAKIVARGKGEVKLVKKILDFRASVSDLREYAAFLKSGQKVHEIERAKNLETIADWMEEANIKKLTDIEKQLNKLDKQSVSKLENYIDTVDDQKLADIVLEGGYGIDEVGDLKALRDLAKVEISDLKKGVQISEAPGIGNYIRASVVIQGGIIGGFIGSELYGDSIQYVDILTKEQYFRQCGTYAENFN